MPINDKEIIAEKIIDELDTSALIFPTCFDLTLRIHQLIDDDDSTLSDIANVVQTDPVLVGKLYTIANSVAFNPSGQIINSVQKMLQRTGLDMIRFLSQTIIKEQILKDFRNKDIKQLSSSLWRYSVDFGSWAYSIAHESRIIRPDEILFNIVMSNIGCFYILYKIQNYPTIVENVNIIKEVVKENGNYITNKILSAYKISKQVSNILDNVDLYKPCWPIKTVENIVTLSEVMTDFNNPFSDTTMSLEEYLETNSYNATKYTDICLYISDVKIIRDILFETITT